MAKQITVTLGDELFKRLSAVKENFNISRVCQEAIESEVTRQEFLLKENQTMEDTIERLRLEKGKYDEQFRKLGYEKGYGDAKEMPYDELLQIGNRDNQVADDARFNHIVDWFDNFADEPGWNEDVFCKGWFEGVDALYEEVKDRL